MEEREREWKRERGGRRECMVGWKKKRKRGGRKKERWEKEGGERGRRKREGEIEEGRRGDEVNECKTLHQHILIITLHTNSHNYWAAMR